MPRSGYTLPVFACASAIAALQWLKQRQPITCVSVDSIEPPQTVEISIEQVAGLGEGQALAITLSDPGDNLDLTRNTPVWALVEWQPETAAEQIILKGGEGVGRNSESGQAAIYKYAQKLLRENLQRLLAPGEKIQVTIVLPEGRQLAERTSNAAFGVVEGLSLLGTSGISQPLSAPGQLEVSLEELREKVKELKVGDWEEGIKNTQKREDFLTQNSKLKTQNSPTPPPALVFCVGENGLDLAQQIGIPAKRIVKTANWLGPMLVEAAIAGVKEILLFGYHGKLIKLAGGIFHTHHHLADGRLEILAAFCGKVGLPTPVLQQVFESATAEAALKYLRNLDTENGSEWVNLVYGAIALAIDDRTQAYIRTHSEQEIGIGSVLFDRQRQIIVKSQIGSQLLDRLR